MHSIANISESVYEVFFNKNGCMVEALKDGNCRHPKQSIDNVVDKMSRSDP